MPDLAEHEQRLGEQGFRWRAVAEIGRDRLLEAGLVVADDLAQPPQAVEAKLERRQRLAPRGVQHGMESVIQG